MRLTFCTSVFMLFVCSCSNPSRSNSAAERQLEDSQIINIMMTVDKGEMAASKEATMKEVSPSVEEYAEYLIEQHGRNLDELNTLAQQLGLQPKESIISKAMVTQGKQNLSTLKGLEGEPFEKAFIDLMVKEHQGGLQLIDSKLLPEAKNPQLKEAVEQFRAMVSNHLEKAREVQSIL